MQQQQATSWWVGKSGEAFSEEAARRFPDMANSAEARGIDPLQGLRENKAKTTSARSAMRLES